ncbi:MAG: DNA polymerase III subunit gamma/tau [Acutalibacteraceae bacterium]
MYLALYRKWRPQTFSDVRGQDHITAVLKNQAAGGRISHAYLFCGSRGTGKTTTAKILAKAANCLDLQDGDPCNRCESCRAIDAGSTPDVLEIDAASNNSVENIRDLREEVVYPPSMLKRRVYIIDEVHMLSTSAFNALLKTLEEPPAHVIFILATTELHAIPATILSRCLRFEFTRISDEVIRERLVMVAKEEAIELTDEAAALLARLADDALRDALSLLESCAAAAGSGPLDAAAVRRQLGVSDDGSAAALLGALLERTFLPRCGRWTSFTANPRTYRSSSRTSELLRYLLIRKSAPAQPDEAPPLSVPKEALEKLRVLCEQATVGELMRRGGVRGRTGAHRPLRVQQAHAAVADGHPAATRAGQRRLGARSPHHRAGTQGCLAAAAPVQRAPMQASAQAPEPAVQTPEAVPAPPPAPQPSPQPEVKAALFSRSAELLEALQGHKNLYSFLSLSRIVEQGDALKVYTDYLGKNIMSTDGAKKLIADAAAAVTGRRFTVEITEKAPEQEHPSLIYELQEAAEHESQIT